MIFKIENNWLVKTEEDMNLDPKRFLHCSNISELIEDVKDHIFNYMEFPNSDNTQCTECIGTNFWDTTFGDFCKEWQKLKGLPEEL